MGGFNIRMFDVGRHRTQLSTSHLVLANTPLVPCGEDTILAETCKWIFFWCRSTSLVTLVQSWNLKWPFLSYIAQVGFEFVDIAFLLTWPSLCACFINRQSGRCSTGWDSIFVPKQGSPHSLFSTCCNCADFTHIFAWKCQKVWKNWVTSISSCKSAHCGRRRRHRGCRRRHRHRHRHDHYQYHYHYHYHYHYYHHHHHLLLLLHLLLHLLHHLLKHQDRIIENHAVFQNFNLSSDATTVAWTCLDMTMAWGDTQAALGFGPPDKKMPANEKWNVSFAFGPSWRWLSPVTSLRFQTRTKSWKGNLWVRKAHTWQRKDVCNCTIMCQEKSWKSGC